MARKYTKLNADQRLAARRLSVGGNPPDPATIASIWGISARSMSSLVKGLRPGANLNDLMLLWSLESGKKLTRAEGIRALRRASRITTERLFVWGSNANRIVAAGTGSQEPLR
ncbi:MAG: hypothetical protein HYR63_12030 [Proteobacteria bacterium]|nr:hypothetical protein [Pseudomonadota bacterium]MBI3498508.1 hypothetical protein [Pseudomonadota bacterium]